MRPVRTSEAAFSSFLLPWLLLFARSPCKSTGAMLIFSLQARYWAQFWVSVIMACPCPKTKTLAASSALNQPIRDRMMHRLSAHTCWPEPGVAQRQRIRLLASISDYLSSQYLSLMLFQDALVVLHLFAVGYRNLSGPCKRSSLHGTKRNYQHG